MMPSESGSPVPGGVEQPAFSGTTTMTILTPDDAVDRLADALTARLARPVSTPWMTAKEAAGYLRCPVSRIRKLTMLGELHPERDGRRVLYHRDGLDAYIRLGGAYAG